MVGSTAHAPSRAGDRPGRGLEQGSPTPDAFSELGRPVLLLGGAQLPGLLAGQAAAESRARGPRGGPPRRLRHPVKAVKQFPCQGFTRIQESLPDAKHPLNTMPPGPRSAAAASRPYIGKSLGIPHPSSGWAPREAPTASA